MVNEISGVDAHIRWAYYKAASLNGYTVTRAGQQWSVRGVVVLADSFKMTQRPLLFVATHAKGEWRWPILSHELHEGHFTAQLGPPLEIEMGDTHGAKQVRDTGNRTA